MRRIFVASVAAALLVTTAGPSSAVDNGTWEGQTRQHEEIKFKVRGGDEIRFLKFTFLNVGCLSELTSWSRNLRVPIVNGRFKMQVGGFQDWEATIKGRFRSDSRAKGTILMKTTGDCPDRRRTGWNADSG